MVVGVLRLTLFLPENHSLKGKRQVLRAIKDRVRNKFNVSIAESDGHDMWQRAELGILSAAERAAQLAGQDPATLGEDVDPVELAQSAAVKTSNHSERTVAPPQAHAAPSASPSKFKFRIKVSAFTVTPPRDALPARRRGLRRRRAVRIW